MGKTGQFLTVSVFNNPLYLQKKNIQWEESKKNLFMKD